MPQFRKRPVVIEANRVPDSPEDIDGWANLAVWLGAGGPWEVNSRHCVTIHTLEGDMLASKGDWIIRGVKGELYPCKPDIFESTYESVEAAVR